jgi:hypothetical protein
MLKNINKQAIIIFIYLMIGFFIICPAAGTCTCKLCCSSDHIAKASDVDNDCCDHSLGHGDSCNDIPINSQSFVLSNTINSTSHINISQCLTSSYSHYINRCIFPNLLSSNFFYHLSIPLLVKSTTVLLI